MNYEHDIIYEKWARQIVFNLRTLIHNLNSVNHNFHPEVN